VKDRSFKGSLQNCGHVTYLLSVVVSLCQKIFSYKKFKFSGVNCLPVLLENFVFKAFDKSPQLTLSGTWKGFLMISENALSQVMVAHDCGS